MAAVTNTVNYEARANQIIFVNLICKFQTKHFLRDEQCNPACRR